MLFDMLKKQTPAKALEIRDKAQARVKEEEAKTAELQGQLNDRGAAAYLNSLVTGEADPIINCPPELMAAYTAQHYRLSAARGALKAAEENYAAALAREAEKKEADRQAKIKAVKADVLKKGKAVDEAMVNLAEAIKALRAAQAAGVEYCPHSLIDEFARANMAIWPVLNRQIVKIAGALPGTTDNRIISDSALATFTQHLPGAQ